MNVDRDLERIALQEKRLVFSHFNAEAAWTIGTALRTEALKRGVSIAIDIQLHGHPLFFCAMPGTTPNNIEWIRRKRNLVNRFQRSSYGIGLTILREQSTLEAKIGGDARDYAAHGGCFPILLPETGCVGTITVSGLPQREDHELVVAVLAEYLKIPITDIKLD